MYVPPLSAATPRLGKAPAKRGASPVQRALDDSPKVAAQQAVASRLAQRKAVVQREGNGLAEPEARAAYALPLVEGLAKAGPGERVALLRDAINRVLTRAGIPPLEIEVLALGDSAHFDETAWKMAILRSSLESDDPGVLAELVGTVYHEARHAEQFFRVAQRAAAGEDEIGLARLKLPRAISEDAVRTKGQFATLGEATRKGAAEWAESLKNPEPVLAALTATGRDLAIRVDAYEKAMGRLMGTLGILRTNLAMGNFGAGVVVEAQAALQQQKSEQRQVRGALGIYRDALLAYRRLPHEHDAHELGWTVEDTFRTGAPVERYDPGHASRVPESDPIWADLRVLDRSLDRLEDLLAALAKTAATTHSVASSAAADDDDDFLEETVEERATSVARFVVSRNPSASFEVEYEKALQELRKRDAEAVPTSDLTPLGAWQQLAVLSEELMVWRAIEPRYLSALSASVHRRTTL